MGLFLIVLVVGEFKNSLPRLRHQAKVLGCRAIHAPDCEKAWRILNTAPSPRLIVLEDNLPYNPRREFLSRVGEEKRLGEIPIILAFSRRRAEADYRAKHLQE